MKKIFDSLFDIDDDEDILSIYIGKHLGGAGTNAKIRDISKSTVYISTDRWLNNKIAIDDESVEMLQTIAKCGLRKIVLEAETYFITSNLDLNNMVIESNYDLHLFFVPQMKSKVSTLSNLSIDCNHVFLGDVDSSDMNIRHVLSNATDYKCSLKNVKIKSKTLFFNIANCSFNFSGCQMDAPDLFLYVFIKKSSTTNRSSANSNDVYVVFDRFWDASVMGREIDVEKFLKFPRIDVSKISCDNIKLISNKIDYVIGKTIKGENIGKGWKINKVNRNQSWYELEP